MIGPSSSGPGSAWISGGASRAGSEDPSLGRSVEPFSASASRSARPPLRVGRLAAACASARPRSCERDSVRDDLFPVPLLAVLVPFSGLNASDDEDLPTLHHQGSEVRVRVLAAWRPVHDAVPLGLLVDVPVAVAPPVVAMRKFMTSQPDPVRRTSAFRPSRPRPTHWFMVDIRVSFCLGPRPVCRRSPSGDLRGCGSLTRRSPSPLFHPTVRLGASIVSAACRRPIAGLCCCAVSPRWVPSRLRLAAPGRRSCARGRCFLFGV